MQHVETRASLRRLLRAIEVRNGVKGERKGCLGRKELMDEQVWAMNWVNEGGRRSSSCWKL